MNYHFLFEIWDSIKGYVPAKEQYDAALSLVELFDEHGLCDGILHESGLDRPLSLAIEDYFGEEEELEEDEDDGNSDW
jgi:hypothetical protein